MTLRELQERTRISIKQSRKRFIGLEGPASDSIEMMDLLHQRMTIMEKIHDFRIHPDGPSYLDVEPEVIEKMSTTNETEDDNGRAEQHKE